MISEQHAADSLVHELCLMNRNYHPIGWDLAGLDHNLGNSFAQRALLFDRSSFVKLDGDFRHSRTLYLLLDMARSLPVALLVKHAFAFSLH